MERGECAYGRGDTLGVVALEGCEVAVSGVYAGEVGEEVAGDDVGEGGGVGVFVQDVLLVQAPGPAGGGPLYAGGGAGQQRMCVRAQQSVAWHRGAGGGVTGGEVTGGVTGEVSECSATECSEMKKGGNTHYIIHRLPGDEAEVNTRDNTGRINIKLPGSLPPRTRWHAHSE